MIKFTFITLFPEALRPYLSASMMWKAVDKGLAKFEFVNLREFGLGPHKSVDDTPYGGGDGMLMRVEPAVAAIESVKNVDKNARVLLPTPAGIRWNQRIAAKMAKGEMFEDAVKKVDNTEEIHYVVFCPKYEGVDERIVEFIDLPVCMGEYILTGGELPALVIADSIVRLIPGVLGGENSAVIESFSDGDNLEFPQWTKPYDWRGRRVPEILLSGNHGEVDGWRAEQAKKRRDEINKKWGEFGKLY